jgi:hypothetical protein
MQKCERASERSMKSGTRFVSKEACNFPCCCLKVSKRSVRHVHFRCIKRLPAVVRGLARCRKVPLPLTPDTCSRFHPGCTPLPYWSSNEKGKRLVAGTLALGDDAGHLVDLSLATAEGAEPLLGELARALVLGVAEEFDDATLVGGEAVDARLVESWWWCCSVPAGSRPSGSGGGERRTQKPP